jgi:hypothetical protein
MINGLLLAFLISLIGTLNLEFSFLKKDLNKYLKGWLENLKYGAIVAAVLTYIGMPALVFPDVLIPLGIIFGINALYTLAKLIQKKPGMIVFDNSVLKSAKVPLFILVLILTVWFFSPLYPIIKAQDLYDIPQVKISQDKLSSIDTAHIRQVPLEFARWKADKVVGELGNKVSVGKLSVQIYNDKLVWVAPLEFNDIFKWLKFSTSPGYVIVDAENPDAQVIKVDDKNLKYLNTAYFQSNLYRRAYQDFPNYRLEEITFEIDDEGKPWWTIAAIRPSVWNTGEKVYGIILLDPETGKTEFYNEAPEWVDRVFPEKVAEDYNYWYGAYKLGYLNTLFVQKDMHIPTGDKFGNPDVFAVRKNNSLVWFTGHTSPSNKDQSLMGYSTIDTRNGEFTFYSNVSGFYNEFAAVSNANSAVSNFKGYHGAQPVFYNLYGQLTWVIPILSDNNKLQRIALVNAATGNVILGDTLELALEDYKSWIRKNVGEIEIQETALKFAKGNVSRKVDNLVVVNNLIFDLQHLEGVETKLTRENDLVLVGYSKKDKIIDAKSFDNLELDFE